MTDIETEESVTENLLIERIGILDECWGDIAVCCLDCPVLDVKAPWASIPEAIRKEIMEFGSRRGIGVEIWFVYNGREQGQRVRFHPNSWLNLLGDGFAHWDWEDEYSSPHHVGYEGDRYEYLIVDEGYWVSMEDRLRPEFGEVIRQRGRMDEVFGEMRNAYLAATCATVSPPKENG